MIWGLSFLARKSRPFAFLNLDVCGSRDGKWKLCRERIPRHLASSGADLNLLVKIAMGIGLLVSVFLPRAKRYAARGVCQTGALTRNLPMIALLIWTSLRVRVLS